MSTEGLDEDLMMDLMDSVNNGIRTESQIVVIAVDSYKYDPQRVIDWIEEYHYDDNQR